MEKLMDADFFRKPLEKQILSLPKVVKFCKKCVVSNQRPRIVFDEEGVCNGCRHAEHKKRGGIDWAARTEELKRVCDKHRRNDGWWDVVVPGSGGKDSAYVAHLLKHEYGMHPLCVTWAPFKYTDIGFENFINFVDSGFTTINTFANGKVHRKLARVALEEVGDNFLPWSWGVHSFVYHMAIKYGVKLVFYGELGELEYGGDPTYSNCPNLPMERWAITHWKGTTVDDLVNYALQYKDYFKREDFSDSDLIFYRPPPVSEMKGVDIHWMSYYRNWIPQENYYYAVENTGFKANPVRSEGTYSKYASLDDRLDGLHFYLMFTKFGIGRATSDAAHEIRDGHLTREEGVALVQKFDHERPTRYLKECLDYLGIDEGHYWEIIDSFRLPHIWKKVDGEWKLRHTVSGNGVDD